METYKVKTIRHKEKIKVSVPGSKSITNRALMLAALGNTKCLLKGVLFSDDSRAFLSCLTELGFDIKVDEEKKEVIVIGTNGQIPKKKAIINVRSAGTAARFLTVMLSVAGGEYVLNSSEQMKKRPMAELIEALRNAGVTITCLEEEGHFPFKIYSKGLHTKSVMIDTTISSQYASALLMAAVNTEGMNIQVTGNRTNGAYINITLNMMKQFGINVTNENNIYTVSGEAFGIQQYQIEPDASAACYFYAMAPLLRSDVVVNNLNFNSMQGDMKFIKAMEQLGCIISEEEDGVHVDGRKIESFEGLDIDMKDFSDQAMTMAVVAAFANSKTIIRNIGHIRLQESDRVNAIVTELNRMGIEAFDYEESGETNILIYPGSVQPCEIETYDDHRIAMSFTLAGLLANGIIIKNPMCCRKTFENYFELIDELTKEK